MGLLVYDNSQGKLNFTQKISDTLNAKTGVQLPQAFITASSFLTT